MKNNKYRLIPEDCKINYGRKLYRIEALKDFASIKKINVPAVIYSPVGKEYHKWSERVNKKSLLQTVPAVTRGLIEQAWHFE